MGSCNGCETLVGVAEPGDSHDRNAVAIAKDGKVIGHLPQKVSRLCALFLKRLRGGNVHCTVTIMAVQFFIGLIVKHAQIFTTLIFMVLYNHKI